MVQGAALVRFILTGCLFAPLFEQQADQPGDFAAFAISG